MVDHDKQLPGCCVHQGEHVERMVNPPQIKFVGFAN